MVPRLQILAAAVLFGTTGTAQALGPASSPLAVGAARVAVGGAVLALLAVLTGALRGGRPSAAPVLVAGAGIAVYQVAFFSAVEATGVGIGTVVAIGSGPVAAGVLERLLGGRWPGRRWAWSTALAALGVALLTLASTGEETIAPAGIALALVAGSGYAAYTVAVRRLVAGGQSPVAVMGASFGSGALILAPVLLLTDASWLARPSGAALALYLGVVPTALAYLLFARGLRHVGAAEATTIVLAEPVTAAALGAAVLDERVGPLGLLGAALVLAALLVLALPGRRRVGTIVAVARR